MRVVCSWNEEKSRWHTYLTNLDPQNFSGEEIYGLYRFRWEIEMLFKELKGEYELGKLLSSRKSVVFINIYVALIRLIISRTLYKNMILCEEETEKQKFSHQSWANSLKEKCSTIFDLIHDDMFGSVSTNERWDKVYDTMRRQAKRISPVPLNQDAIFTP
jgi:putative transposase